MKKRIITLLAILAVMVACVVFAVQADAVTKDTSAQTAFNGFTDECPHCGEVIAEADWTEFTASSTIATGKHYMISENLTLSAMKASGSAKAVVWIRDDVIVTAASGANAFRVNNASGELWLLGGSGAKITGTGATATHAGNGGLLRVLVGGKMYIDGDLTIQLTGAVTSGSMGGLIDINNGTLYFNGGTMISAQDSSTGTVRGAIVLSAATGNLVMDGGRILAEGSKNNAIFCEKAASIIIKGNSYIEGTKGYSSVYMTAGTLTIDGNATIIKPTTGGENAYETNLYIKNPAKLQIAQTWDGAASVKFLNSSGTQQTLQPGKTSYSTYVTQVILKDGAYVNNTWAKDGSGNADSEEEANQSFDGYMICESPNTDNPRLNGWQHLIMPRRFQIVYADGTMTWETDYNTTLKVWNLEDACIKVWATDRPITIPAGKTVYIDFNGQTLSGTLTVNGTLYAFDSTAEAPSAGVAIAPAAAGTGTVKSVTEFGGNSYVVVDNVIYPVEVAITSASLRLATAGIYYTADVTADDAAKAVLTCGVAVKLNSEVTELNGTAYTAGVATDGVNSIIVNSILTDAKADAGRADRVIYAKAYVTYNDEMVALSEAKNYSLTGLMELIAERFSVTEGDKALPDTSKQAIQEFYNDFADSVGWATNEAMKAIREFAPTEA